MSAPRPYSPPTGTSTQEDDVVLEDFVESGHTHDEVPWTSPTNVQNWVPPPASSLLNQQDNASAAPAAPFGAPQQGISQSSSTPAVNFDTFAGFGAPNVQPIRTYEPSGPQYPSSWQSFQGPGPYDAPPPYKHNPVGGVGLAPPTYPPPDHSAPPPPSSHHDQARQQLSASVFRPMLPSNIGQQLSTTATADDDDDEEGGEDAPGSDEEPEPDVESGADSDDGPGSDEETDPAWYTPAAAKCVSTLDHVQKRVMQGKGGYGALIKKLPPPNIAPPRNIDITMMEICTFFPSWFQIEEVPVRAIRNGLSRRHIAKAQLYGHGQLTRDNHKTAEDRIQKQISDGGKRYTGNGTAPWNSADQRRRLGDDDDLTSNNWTLHHPQGWQHMKLVDITKEIVHWPPPGHGLLLTRCLRFAALNPEMELDTSHWDWLIQRVNSNPQLVPVGRDHTHDEQAMAWIETNIADP